MADGGTIEVGVKVVDDLTGEQFPLTELAEFNPWPHSILTGVIQGVTVAAVLIAAHLVGLL